MTTDDLQHFIWQAFRGIHSHKISLELPAHLLGESFLGHTSLQYC